MSGQVYELPVWDTITASWDKVSGAKGSFWASLGILFAIMFGIGIFQGLSEDYPAIAYVFSFAGNVIAYFIQLGMIYMGITRAKGNPINFKMMFYSFNLQLALLLIGLYLLQLLIFLIPMSIAALGGFLLMIGNVFTIILGILFCIAAFITFAIIGVRLSLSMAFVLDTGIAPVAALKASLKATEGNFWSLVGTFLLQFLIILASAIPLGIGLIWTLPFGFICYGMIYQRLRANA